MEFKTWIEGEMGLGAGTPEMLPDGGRQTPASDEVKNTGLQPQVGSEEIDTKEKNDHDKIMSIDSEIEHLDSRLPEDENPKINKFKELWDELKERWSEIKMADEIEQQFNTDGLGSEMGDENYRKMMQQHPNMTPSPAPENRSPNGTGIFGSTS